MASSLNITIAVAPSLQSALDGREEISLGVPASADVGDVIVTLLQLYPKLRRALASDVRVSQRTVQLVLSERGTRALANRGSGLHEGEKLLLVPASSTPRDDLGFLKG